MSKLDSFLVQTAVSHCEHWFAAKFCSDQHGGHVNISYTIDFRGHLYLASMFICLCLQYIGECCSVLLMCMRLVSL